MCAITGSFTKHKLKDLYRLNTYRGELSYSLCTIRYAGKVTELGTLMQDNNKMPDTLIDSLPVHGNTFYIPHSQAPTTSTNNIHPAVYGDTLLWHNGIIKQKGLNGSEWDTHVLLQSIVDYGWSSLSRIDGTFACMMYRGDGLFVCRNEISPMFYNVEFHDFEYILEKKIFYVQPDVDDITCTIKKVLDMNDSSYVNVKYTWDDAVKIFLNRI